MKLDPEVTAATEEAAEEAAREEGERVIKTMTGEDLGGLRRGDSRLVPYMGASTGPPSSSGQGVFDATTLDVAARLVAVVDLHATRGRSNQAWRLAREMAPSSASLSTATSAS